MARREERFGETTLDRLVRADAASSAKSAEHSPDLDESLAFVLDVGRALLSYGLPAQRVEDAISRLARHLELQGSFYSTPTALVLTLSDGKDHRTRVVRVDPGDTDLERLSALHELVGRVERHELTPVDARRRLAAILARPPRYGRLATMLAAGLASGSSALLLRGSLEDVAVAAILGMLVGLIGLGASGLPVLARLLPAVAATIASFASALLDTLGINPGIVVLASLIVLLPGLTLTAAMIELATANLVSGTARLMSAATTLLQLGFGVALGQKLVAAIPDLPFTRPAAALPAWTHTFAPVLAGVAFSVLLRVRPRDFFWVLGAVVVAVIGARAGGAFLGAEVGAFLGAFLVGVVSHAFARFRDRPVMLLLTPGILTLVPGSVGFLSVASMLDQEVIPAIETGFRMLLIGMALTAGVLLSTLAVPPKRAL